MSRWAEQLSGANDEETLGPGTDLVISLFALLLLLVLIGGGLQLALARKPVSPAAKATAPPVPPPAKAVDSIYTVADEKGRAKFEAGEATLTGEAQAELDAVAARLLTDLRDRRHNQIAVRGHVSGELGEERSVVKGRIWALRLSTQRALSVVEYLGRKGIPLECMHVTGMGRSHSDALNELRRRGDAPTFRVLDGWDKETRGTCDDPRWNRERRIEIRLVSDAESPPCLLSAAEGQ